MVKVANRAAVGREPLVDINAVAEQLGVTPRHVRRLVAERRIPYVKWGTCFGSTPASSPSGSINGAEPDAEPRRPASGQHVGHPFEER